MDAETILNLIGDRQGWNDESKLALCLEYIENQKSPEAFKDFLEDRASFEGEEA